MQNIIYSNYVLDNLLPFAFSRITQVNIIVSDDMKISFVLDICKRKDRMLTKWVQEIFDKDGMYVQNEITLYTETIYVVLFDCTMFTL